MMLPHESHPPIAKICSNALESVTECTERHNKQMCILFRPRQQHDCHEYISRVLAFINTSLNEEIVLQEALTCIKCSLTNEKDVIENCLTFVLPQQDNQITIQKLLDKYFMEVHSVERNCNNCSGKFSKQKYYIKKLPCTLVIHLQRTQYCKTKKAEVKNTSPIHPDMHIFCGQYRFNLRSMVVHNGDSPLCGHYYANIIHADSTTKYSVKCDDETITSKNISDNFSYSCQTGCYFLLYDMITYSDSFFECIKVILQQLSHTKSFREKQLMCTAQKSGKERISRIFKYSENSILLTEAATELSLLLCDNKLNKQYKSKQLLFDIVTHLFGSPEEDTNSLFTCNLLVHGKCSCCAKISNSRIKKNFSLFTSKNLNNLFDDIVPYFVNKIVSPCCQSELEEIQLATSTLPLNIILHVENNNTVPVNFSVSFNDIASVYAGDLASYHCLGAFVLNDDQRISFTKTISNDVSKNCFILLELTLCKFNFNLATVSPFHCGTSLSYLKNCNQQPSVSRNSEHDINEHLLRIITSKNGWFNSTIIDNYMKLLSHTHYLHVHAVCSSWVGERLFTLYSNSPTLFILNEEHKNILWFDNDYVLIPVNVNKSHWILYVLAVCERTLYICDSKNQIYSDHTSQIMRYIAVEHFKKFGQCLSTKELRICNYSSSPNFPVQTDAHSCGPYVCMMAKAIVYSMQFNFQPAQARNTIAQELNSCKLYNVTNYTDKINSLHFSYPPIFSIKDSLSSDYHGLLGDELREIILAFSHEDEKIIKDNFLDRGKTVTVVKFSKTPINVPLLNDIGIEMRNNINPNVFNFLINDENISRKLTEI